MKADRRVLLFAVALVFAAATSVGILISIDRIRDTVRFSRVIRRIDAADPDPALLREAARYARSRDDWRLLLRFAWSMDARGPHLRDLAAAASNAFPDEAVWRSIAAFGALDAGDRAGARELMQLRQRGDRADSLEEWLVLLARIDPADPAESRNSLAELAEAAERYPVGHAVASAEINRNPVSLRNAWELSSVGAYALQGALEAAAAGNRVLAASLIDAAREADLMPDAARWDAPLYLALWLDDTDWLFDQLTALPGRRIGEPSVLLVQAEGHRRQGRLVEARRFYRELQTVAGDFTDVAFLNDAALTWLLDDEPAEPILRAGLAIHPQSGRLRGELAGLLVRENRRLAAVQLLSRQLVGPDRSTLPAAQAHRDWLLTRAILGSRQPLERLESDLWQYLNQHPDATTVARYLARFLALRMDEAGMARLAERYPLEFAPWSRPLHAYLEIAEDDLTAAESILAEGDADSVAAWYNRVLFALRYVPLPEAEILLNEARAWLAAGPPLSQTASREAERQLLILEAEFARLSGDPSAALVAVDRALRISSDPDLRAYRSILASP